MILFTSLIVIHELGHYVTAYLLKWKVKEIRLYPYGGCSHFEVDLNKSSLEEFLVLIMGPIIQILFTYILTFYLREQDSLFLINSSKVLLIFNLLPIYPLDGGKLLFLFLSLLFSYYHTLKYTYFISLFVYLIIFFSLILIYKSWLWIFLFFSLFFRLWKEQKEGNYLYEKFLLERYLNNYYFKRKKIITSPLEMKKEYTHLFFYKKGLLEEKKYLGVYFENMEKNNVSVEKNTKI